MATYSNRLLAVFLGVLLSTTDSLAQTPDKNKNEAAQKREKAAALYEEASAYFKIREYEQALSRYKEAYLLSLEPSLLFNMAQCHRLLGHIDEALSLYRSFITDVPQSPLVKTAEDLIKQLEEEKAKAPSTAPASTSAPVLNPNITPPTNTAPALQPEQTPSLQKETPLFVKGLYGASAGAGVLALATGAVALIAAKKSADLQQAGDFSLIRAQVDRSRSFALLADLSLGVAVATAGAGYLLKRKAEATVTPGGLALRVEF